MRIPTRFYKRGDTYYYRRRAPLSIARLTNRTDYKYSLRVTNMKAARELSLGGGHILDCAFMMPSSVAQVQTEHPAKGDSYEPHAQ